MERKPMLLLQPETHQNYIYLRYRDPGAMCENVNKINIRLKMWTLKWKQFEIAVNELSDSLTISYNTYNQGFSL